MKALVFNASPKTNNGLTAKILNPFIEGMEKAGAQIKLLYTRKLFIKPCDGCYKCWFLTPGKCTIHDDMEDILKMWAVYDIIVIAAPLYSDGLPSEMKCILDRRLPLSLPEIIRIKESCHHKIRYSTKNKKLMLVSTCGFWGMDNFDPLVSHIKAVCRNGEREYAGALLRPHSIALENRFARSNKNNVESVYNACREAGEELITGGSISEDTLKEISRDLMPMDDYIKAANSYFSEVNELYNKIVKKPDEEEMDCY
jgi:multimeric flavodoxin WrbA